MPSPRSNRFELTIRRANGLTTNYSATPVGDRLLFGPTNQTLAIRAGVGRQAMHPELAELTNCLLTVPGREGYCRRADTADALPLTPGAYVAVRHACGRAERSGTIYFDGQSLSRPGQNACHTSVIRQHGVVFHLNDRCTAAATTSEIATVPDRHRMALRIGHRPARLYRYCATTSLPQSLQIEARQAQR